ncbi:Proteophosphoglycan 5, related [Neospora caninum Liverpool]|uniref:Proteophosphoglycan 5, related n=1 Tax=Neospora caninum (strain Liverpool) TaxID=572307 RepID=F0VQY8_NEOCL|nr:Proteophosphoglycan 5, related [Neospora caninum Liverpool]CBZ56135.1 Proteophosphoglycan 5, related [Neospora caninum Liverpool]CEL70891.1 TPA: Proteophosphoglycan 5, related [Neospora caninum Liverpool]|eukprot:XP_003886161.1 Proteophosphoglycan 5, related [Neospora caninum Liverpool]
MASPTAGSPGVHSPPRHGVSDRLLATSSPQGRAARPSVSELRTGKLVDESKTARPSKGSPLVWRAKPLAPSPSVEALGFDEPSLPSNMAMVQQNFDADQVSFDSADCRNAVPSSEYDAAQGEDESEGGTEFEEQQTRAQTNATSDLDYCYSVNRLKSTGSDQVLSPGLSGELHSAGDARTCGSLSVATEPAANESPEAAAYAGATLLTAPLCPVADEANFPQSNGSESSLHSHTSRLSEEVLAQLNQKQKSISSSSSRAQLLLGQRAEGPISQLEHDGASVLHYLTELGQTFGGPSLEELMKFQAELSPRQDDDEISFELSQDSESERAVSPVNEANVCIGPSDDRGPINLPTEFASASGFWDRNATEMHPVTSNSPTPVPAVPHSQPSDGAHPSPAVTPSRPSPAAVTPSRPSPAAVTPSRPSSAAVAASRPSPAAVAASRPSPAAVAASRPSPAAAAVAPRLLKKPAPKAKQPAPAKETGPSRPRGRCPPAAKPVPSHAVASALGVSRNARTVSTAPAHQAKSAGPQALSSASAVQERKSPRLPAHGGAPGGNAKPAVPSRHSCSPAIFNRVSAAQLIKQISGAAAGGTASPRRGPSWTELPPAARAQIIAILQQQRIILTSRAQIRKAVEAIRRACGGKSPQRSSSGSSAATSRQSSRAASRGAAAGRKVVPISASTSGNPAAAPRSPAHRHHPSTPRRSSVGSRSRNRVASAQTGRPQNNRHLRRSLSENHTSLRAAASAPRPLATRARGSLGALAPGRTRSSSRLLCPHGLRYKSLCAFCGHPDRLRDTIANRGFAQPTVASRMQATDAKKPGSAAGRRGTPLKANASRAKLWTAGGVSSHAATAGAGALGGVAPGTVSQGSRFSVGSSWTSTGSMSRASTGSKALDCSVDMLDSRSLGAARGRSRSARPLPQHANRQKGTHELPSVFARLWESAMEKQRARSQDPPLAGSTRSHAPRLSLAASTGSQNSAASRRRLSEKNAKGSSATPRHAAGNPCGESGSGTESAGRRAQALGPSGTNLDAGAAATQAASAQEKNHPAWVVSAAGADHGAGMQRALLVATPASYLCPEHLQPTPSPPTVPLWQAAQSYVPHMAQAGQFPSHVQNLDYGFEPATYPAPRASMPPPLQGNPNNPVCIANHHAVPNIPGQPGFPSGPPSGAQFGLYPNMGSSAVPYVMSPMPPAQSPNPAPVGNASATFNPLYQAPFPASAMSPAQQPSRGPVGKSQFVSLPHSPMPGASLSPASYSAPHGAPPASESVDAGDERQLNEGREASTPIVGHMHHPSGLVPSASSEQSTRNRESGKIEGDHEAAHVDSRRKRDPAAGLSSFCISNLHIASRPIPRVVAAKRPVDVSSKKEAVHAHEASAPRAKNGKASVSRPEHPDKKKPTGGSPLKPMQSKGGASKADGHAGAASGPVKSPQRKLSLPEIAPGGVDASRGQNLREMSRQELWQDAWQRQVAQWQQHQAHPSGAGGESVSAVPHTPVPAHPSASSVNAGPSSTPIPSPKESVPQPNGAGGVEQQSGYPGLPHAFSFSSCPPLPVSSPCGNGSLVYVNSPPSPVQLESAASAVPTPAPSSLQAGSEQESGKDSAAWGWPEAAEALAISIAEENGVYREGDEAHEPARGAPPVGSLSRFARRAAFPWSPVAPTEKAASPVTQAIPATKPGAFLASGLHKDAQGQSSGAMRAGANCATSGAMLFRMGGTEDGVKAVDWQHSNVFVCGPSALSDFHAVPGLHRTLLGQPPFVRTKPQKAQGSGVMTPRARGAMTNQRMVGTSTAAWSSAADTRGFAFQC